MIFEQYKHYKHFKQQAKLLYLKKINLMQSDTNNCEKNLPLLSQNEIKEKTILEFVYLKNIIEKLLSENDHAEKKNIVKLLKCFENDLENVLETKISSKEKATYLQLKTSGFDSTILKLSKYIH